MLQKLVAWFKKDRYFCKKPMEVYTFVAKSWFRKLSCDMVSTLLSFFANSNFCIFHSALMNNIVTVQRHRQSQNLKMCLTEQPTKPGLGMLTHIKKCIPGHNRQITDADYIYIVTVLSFLCPYIFPYCNNENLSLDNATSYGKSYFDLAIWYSVFLKLK